MGWWLWIPLPTKYSGSCAPCGSRGNKGVTSVIWGFIPIYINRSNFGHRRRLLVSKWLLGGKTRWVFPKFNSWQAALFDRKGHNLLLPPFPPPLSLYQRPQINSKRFEIIIGLWSTSMKIYKANLQCAFICIIYTLRTGFIISLTFEALIFLDPKIVCWLYFNPVPLQCTNSLISSYRKDNCNEFLHFSTWEDKIRQ